MKVKVEVGTSTPLDGLSAASVHLCHEWLSWTQGCGGHSDIWALCHAREGQWAASVFGPLVTFNPANNDGRAESLLTKGSSRSWWM